MRASFPVRLLTLSTVLGLAACGGGGDDGGTGGVTPPPGGSGGGDGGSGGGSIPPSGGGGGAGGAGGTTTPSSVAAYGVFEIHYKELGFTSVEGLMRDKAPPEAILWEKSKTEGDCSLYKPRAPFCESCDPPNTCSADNVCSTPPSTFGVGTVSVTGLASKSSPLVLMDVRATTITYQSAETLPLPPCEAGGVISLNASGEGDYPAFSIQGQCIAPLAVTNTAVAIESGKPFTLTWTAGAVAGARITLAFDLSHHGGSKGRLICDTADTGSLVVSGAMIKSLMDLGVTGWPKADVTRIVTAKTTVGSGQAELKVYADKEYLVQIPGVVSCNTNADCTEPGETCQNPGMMCGISCTTNADCPTGKTCFAATKVCK